MPAPYFGYPDSNIRNYDFFTGYASDRAGHLNRNRASGVVYACSAGSVWSGFSHAEFRKFKKSCGADGLPLTLSEDERLTHVGKFLRSTKLDELPQLWNVLIGDMSIVGPRPESLAFAECFAGGFETVLEFKPGLVGPSQAAFRSEAEFIPTKDYSTEFYRTILFPLKALIDIK